MSNYVADQKFKGVYSLLLTPFLENKEIDWKTYEQYLDWQLASKPNGLFAVCGSSEMMWLNLEERLALTRKAVSLAGKTPVVATSNLGANLQDHPEEIKQMVATGVSGIVLVPPPNLGQEMERLEEYLAQMASFSSVPVFLYEWPQVSPYHHLPADVYARLVKQAGIKGIKDTTSTMEGIMAKIKQAPESIVYQANTPFMLEALNQGAQGIMAITSAAASSLVVQLWKHSQSNQQMEAKHVHQQLVYLDAILCFGYPPAAKYLASLQGIPFSTTSRWPVSLHQQSQQAMTIWHDHFLKK